MDLYNFNSEKFISLKNIPKERKIETLNFENKSFWGEKEWMIEKERLLEEDGKLNFNTQKEY